MGLGKEIPSELPTTRATARHATSMSRISRRDQRDPWNTTTYSTSGSFTLGLVVGLLGRVRKLKLRGGRVGRTTTTCEGNGVVNATPLPGRERKSNDSGSQERSWKGRLIGYGVKGTSCERNRRRGERRRRIKERRGRTTIREIEWSSTLNLRIRDPQRREHILQVQYRCPGSHTQRLPRVAIKQRDPTSQHSRAHLRQVPEPSEKAK